MMPTRKRGAVMFCLLMVSALSAGVAASAMAMAGSDDATALVEAVKEGDLETLRHLLAQGLDVNAAEVDGATALHWAAHRDDDEAVDLLISAGADVTAANRYGVAPLSLTCENGSASIIKRLLRAGADPNTALPEGETALMTAARTGEVAAVRVLLDHGADVNARETGRGQSALMWAAAAGNAEAVRVLLEHGAHASAVSRGPKGVRDAAVGSADATMGRERSVDAFTALHFAAREGHTGVVQVLLESGVDVDEVATEGGGTALSVAIANAHWELASVLWDKGADPDRASALIVLMSKRSPMTLSSAVPLTVPTGRMSSLELAERILAAGADVDITKPSLYPSDSELPTDDGMTPFLMAAKAADLDMLRLLAANGADRTARAASGTTALMLASGVEGSGGNDGNPEISLEAVKLLFELGGVEVNAVNPKNETALIGAAFKGVPEIVQLLIDSGATLDVKTRTSYRFGPGQPQIPGVVEPEFVYGCTALAMAVSSPNCRPLSVYTPHKEAEEVLRRALRERGLSDYVDMVGWWTVGSVTSTEKAPRQPPE